MKNILIKSSTMFFYILALLWFAEFNFRLLFDLKSMGMLLFGTVLLTFPTYLKDKDMGNLIVSAKWNSQVTAYLTTFASQFALLSSNQTTIDLVNRMVLNCRPLLYELLIYMILTQLAAYVDSDETESKRHEENVSFEILKAEYQLTQREMDIAKLILLGHSNKEIGNNLFISENTVKKHVYNLFKKLEVENREQLKNKILNKKESKFTF